jgi:hypothetical protein
VKKRNGWVGFDFDGTLATHEPGSGVDHVGEPIPTMVKVAKDLLAEGKEVRIVTARVSPEWNDQAEQTKLVQDWCEKHIGQRLAVQAHKNGSMYLLYDDRAIGVQRNTGIPLHQVHLAVDRAVAAQRIERVFQERTGILMDPRVAEDIAAAILQSPKEPT